MTANSMRKLTFWCMAVFVAVSAFLALDAVDSVTLPTREGTQLTIYNSEGIMMVQEQWLLTVKAGVNRIQFSLSNTLINPASPARPKAGRWT